MTTATQTETENLLKDNEGLRKPEARRGRRSHLPRTEAVAVAGPVLWDAVRERGRAHRR